MTSDRALVRLVGGTVCLLALIAVAVLAVAALRGDPVADSLDRLAYLLAGGLLGALTTRLTGPDPLPVTTAPGDSLTVEPVYDDTGATDIVTALVVVFVCVCILLVLGVL